MQKQTLKIMPLESTLKTEKSPCKKYWQGSIQYGVRYTDGSCDILTIKSYADKTKTDCIMWLWSKLLRAQRTATIEIFDEL